MGEISERGKSAITPLAPYFVLFQETLSDLYSPENKSGYLSMAVAENKLLFHSHLKPELEKVHKQTNQQDFDTFQPFYGNFDGQPKFKQTIASFLNSHLVSPSSSFKFHPHNIKLTSGCTQAFDLLAWTLCDKGETVLIPSPMYAAFLNDFTQRSQLNIIEAKMDMIQMSTLEFDFKLTEKCLNVAFNNADIKPKILVLVNPGNPFSTALSAEDVKMALDWAKDKNMHVIVDEIYALSANEDSGFCSVVNLKSRLGSDVTLVYGMSKDFGLSGSRLGIVYSENEMVLSSLGGLIAHAGGSSVLNQQLLNRVLNHRSFVDKYLGDNILQLSKFRERLKSILTDLTVPFSYGQTGLYLVADFRKLIKKLFHLTTPPTFTHETQFMHLLFNEHKILFTPGQSCLFPSPGFFRICFAFHPHISHLSELATRLKQCLMRSVTEEAR